MSISGLRYLALLCLAVATLTAVSAQERRDQRGAKPAGTAAISGVLVSDDDPKQPVRRAIVSLSAAELPLGRTVITDGDGRFAFGGLPAGRFALKAAKGGYLTTTLGAKRSERQGTTLVLAPGEQLTGVTFRIPRAAAITGTVTSPNGDPMPGLQVSAVSVHAPELQPVSLTTVGFVTDDRGVYRVFGLAPGDYYIVASPPRQSTGAGSATARSSAEVDAIFRHLRDMTHGLTPGASARPPGRPAAPSLEKAANVGYAPIFYPGTPNGADATIVSLAAGHERTGVDVVFDRVRTAAIEGIVTSPSGPLPRVILSIAPQGPQLRGIYGGSPVVAQPIGADGRFKYAGVAPGQYTIYVRSTGAAPPPSGRGGGNMSAPGDAAAQTQWASADVTVSGQDLTVSLDLQPALRVIGRLAFQGTSPAPEQFAGVRLSLAREGSAGMSVLNNTAIGTPPVSPAAIRPDGTFEFGGILPGRYRLSATTPAGSPWWLRSAMADGRDLLDVPLVIEARDVTNVALTFLDLQSELSGRLQRADGTPAFDSTIIVFSSNPETWRKGSRRIQTAVPASDGRYSVRGLPGGEYLIAMLPDVDPAQLTNREFLTQLAAASLKITLAEGEQKRQDLQVAR
jgi:hypothetical protein